MSHRLTMLDPTNPSRWPDQQARGRAAFQLTYGVMWGGLPLSLLFDGYLLVTRGDLAWTFTAHHAVQLLLITLTVAPAAGALLGRVLWRVGERRYGDLLLTQEFLRDVSQPEPAPAATASEKL